MFTISVITVTLNCEDTIEKTILSVINQPYKNIEFIIIDGGSSDNTNEIISKYKKNLACYISEPDSGIYEAMNKGIRFSNGEGLIFLNAGDYFVGDVFYGIQFPSLIPVMYKNFFGKYVFARLKIPFIGIPYCHQGIIFSKRNFTYKQNYRISADYDFFLQHFKGTYNDLNINDINGFVVFDNQGISSQNSVLRDKENLEIIRNHYGLKISCLSWLYFNLKRIVKKISQVFR
jgi:putative colanic acid biosynthesis glycosyltransferase